MSRICCPTELDRMRARDSSAINDDILMLQKAYICPNGDCGTLCSWRRSKNHVRWLSAYNRRKTLKYYDKIRKNKSINNINYEVYNYVVEHIVYLFFW